MRVSYFKVFLVSIFFLFFTSLSSYSQYFGNSSKDKKSKKKNASGYMMAKKSLKQDNPDYEKLHRNTVEKGKYTKLDCPDKNPKKVSKPDLPDYETVAKANIIRSSTTVHFDLIELEDVHLDIPAFKLFENNMTDFTADGEHEFQEILLKIGHFLGKNHEGKGVTLKIVGSASQIPTSFNNDSTGNNINPDGSSIAGRTSIENNRKLAKARANELAHKIMLIFPSIKIETPTLEQIEIGKTKWTKEVQRALNKAHIKGDKKAIEAIFEPFQKDQWVKVESKDRTSKTIQPESIKMYMVSTSPCISTKVNGVDQEIKSVIIISKKTFDEIGDHRVFGSVANRDLFLKNLEAKIYVDNKNGVMRYYMLRGNEEIRAFNIEDKNERIYEMYKLGIVDNLDEQVLEEHIIANLKSLHQANTK